MDMAPNIMTELPTPSSSSARISTPTPKLRNPLPLTAAQEAQVRDLYYKRVRTLCADEIKEFAACARNRTFSLAYACRTEQLAMNSCMISHSGQAAEDAAREEWFAGIEERRRKKEEDLKATEARRSQVIEMTRQQEEKERREAEERKSKEMADKEGKGKGGWWR